MSKLHGISQLASWLEMRLFSVLARCGRIIVSFPAQEVVGYNFDKELHFSRLRLKFLVRDG